MKKSLSLKMILGLLGAMSSTAAFANTYVHCLGPDVGGETTSTNFYLLGESPGTDPELSQVKKIRVMRTRFDTVMDPSAPVSSGDSDSRETLLDETWEVVRTSTSGSSTSYQFAPNGGVDLHFVTSDLVDVTFDIPGGPEFSESLSGCEFRIEESGVTAHN